MNHATIFSIILLASICGTSARPFFTKPHLPTASESCEIWKGFGYSLTGPSCEDVIGTTCPVIMQTLAEVIDLFSNFEFGKIFTVLPHMFASYTSLTMQAVSCGYHKHFRGALGHLWKFISDLFGKWAQVEPHLIAAGFAVFASDYNQVGTCLADAWREIETM